MGKYGVCMKIGARRRSENEIYLEGLGKGVVCSWKLGTPRQGEVRVIVVFVIIR